MTATTPAPADFSLLQHPLSGSSLVEASAGTGKTFSITTLVLRAVVNHAMPLGQILVVTFTRKATEELRVRIGQRLEQALQGLADPSACDPDDLVLRQWLSGPLPEDAMTRLRIALESIDEASVYTLHGFAQRVLQQEALTTGVPLERELLSSDSELWLQVVQDAWRKLAADSNNPLSGQLLMRGGSPEALAKRLGNLGSSPVREVIPQPRGAQQAQQNHQRLATALDRVEQLAGCWQAQWQDLQATLTAGSLHKSIYSEKLLTALEADLQAAFVLEGISRIGALGEITGLNKLTRDYVGLKTGKGKDTPQHPLLDQFDRMISALTQANEVLQEDWYDWCYQLATEGVVQLRAAKRAAGVCSYDDLMVDLHQALSGTGGSQLAGHLQARYPLALIDEFQDTDPLQWAVLSQIYQAQLGPQHNPLDDHSTGDGPGDGQGNGPSDPATTGMILVGDPKQAIYGFRGADVFAYIDAAKNRQTVTMGRNYRSRPQLVHAINALFAQPGSFLLDDIHFHSVSANRSSDQNSGLHIRWQQQTSGSTPGDRALAAELAAQETAGLIARDVPPGEIAILVRSNEQIGLVAKALASQGIECARMGKSSVFSSPEADQVLRLLRAILQPGKRSDLYSALLTPMLGWTLEQLAALDANLTGPAADHSIQERANRIREALLRARERWDRHGFGSMFLPLLDDLQIPIRLLGQVGGERCLTNVEQLGELLTLQSATDNNAPDQLLHWLSTQLHEGSSENAEAEQQKLRLENDQSVVQVLTVHASKGLEYPHVICPYLWDVRAPTVKAPVSFHDPDHNHSLRVWLAEEVPQKVIDQRKLELAADEMRVLYVALTRARESCLIVWGPFKGVEQSSLARLYERGFAELDAEDLNRADLNQADWKSPAASDGSGSTVPKDVQMRAQIEAFQAHAHALVPELDPQPVSIRAQRPLLLPTSRLPSTKGIKALELPRKLSRFWRVSSYSALVAEHADTPDPTDYDAVAQRIQDATQQEHAEDRFRFPAGARIGIFLHALLERVDFCDPEHLASVAREEIQRFGIDTKWESTVLSMLSQALDTPFGGDTQIRLNQIPRSSRLDELEFYYPVAPITPTALSACVPSWNPGQGGQAEQRPDTRFAFAPFHGFMRGFIDLIFESQGRWYLADYKSNRLGYSQADYRPSALASAMHDHSYDLQGLIYAIALHRYLLSSLPDYDYSSHFGGVAYLFLRGMDPAHGDNAGVHFWRPERTQISRLDRLLSGK